MIILGQSVSRVYLGVHFASDVIGGTVVGLITVVAYVLFRNSIYWSLFSRRKWLMAVVLAGAIGLYAFFMINDININAVVAMGALIGVIVGHLLADHFCSYSNPEFLLKKLMIGVMGMVILLMVQVALKSIIPLKQSLWYVLVMYFILGTQITYIFSAIVKLLNGKKVSNPALTK